MCFGSLLAVGIACLVSVEGVEGAGSWRNWPGRSSPSKTLLKSGDGYPIASVGSGEDVEGPGRVFKTAFATHSMLLQTVFLSGVRPVADGYVVVTR